MPLFEFFVQKKRVYNEHIDYNFIQSMMRIEKFKETYNRLLGANNLHPCSYCLMLNLMVNWTRRFNI